MSDIESPEFEPAAGREAQANQTLPREAVAQRPVGGVFGAPVTPLPVGCADTPPHREGTSRPTALNLGR